MIHAQYVNVFQKSLLTRLCHLMQSDHGVRGLLVTEKQSRVAKVKFTSVSLIFITLSKYNKPMCVCLIQMVEALNQPKCLWPRDHSIWNNINKWLMSFCVSVIRVMDMDNNVILWRGWGECIAANGSASMAVAADNATIIMCYLQRLVPKSKLLSF